MKPAPIKYLLALGDIEFSAIQGPTGWEESENTTLPEHSVILGKPRLQFFGTDLIDLTLTLKLAAPVTKTPVEWMLARLREAQRNGEILPLRLGAGFYKGRYVISKFSHNPGKMLPNGVLVWAEVTLGLKEYTDVAALTVTPVSRPAVIPATGSQPATTKKGK